jgi:hypothetical protein
MAAAQLASETKMRTRFVLFIIAYVMDLSFNGPKSEIFQKKGKKVGRKARTPRLRDK